MKIMRSSLGLLLVCLVLVIGVAYKVNAAVIITAEEIGGNVVFSTSPGGSLNLAGLTANCVSSGCVSSNNFITPNDPSVVMGNTFFLGDEYIGISGPDSFGPSGTFTSFDSGTGDGFGINQGKVLVYKDYVSGDPLSATNTIVGETFASLLMTPGTYVWSWSSDSITLNIGAVPVPPAVWLFGSGLLGLVGMARRKKII